MTNEILLIVNLIFLYSSVLVVYRYFGLKGMYGFSIFVTIAANIEVLILVDAFSMEQTLGNILFACSFLITDIVSENYGKKEAQKVVNINIVMCILFIVISQMWLRYVPSVNDMNYDHISSLFANTPRLMLSSIGVYAIVQKIDVILYHRIWSYTTSKFNDSKKYLYVRNNLATLISQLLNTLFYTTFAFAGIYSLDVLISIIITSYLIFIVTSICDTPIVYFARKIYNKHNLV